MCMGPFLVGKAYEMMRGKRIEKRKINMAYLDEVPT